VTALAAVPAGASDILILSAFPTEQTVLLAAAQPVTEVGTFNGRRFFRGAISGNSVVLGLTGIGMLNADATARAVLDSTLRLRAIIFSGVAGGEHRIGDVVVPDSWTDGENTYPVSRRLFAKATRLSDVPMNPCLPIEDAACLGLRFPLRTPICIAGGAAPQLWFGGLGSSSDPFGPNKVPCLSHAGNLIGCEACGAPLNTSPGVAKFVTDASPFLDPSFYVGLVESFQNGGGNQDIVVSDEETAAVARLASARGIPFIAFRALSDSSAADKGGDPLMLPGFPVTFFVYAQLAADNAAAAVLAFLSML
jgi:adenosylhomocysteine nucleosidase